MINPLTLADLMTDPGELDVTCLDCHHNTTMPVAALLSRYAGELYLTYKLAQYLLSAYCFFR